MAVRFGRGSPQRCDQFHDLGALSDAAAAQKIADAKIDILIDLNGHTEGARFGILARRPAPVQAGWLAMPEPAARISSTTVIADAHVAPRDKPSRLQRKDHPPSRQLFCQRPPAHDRQSTGAVR